MTAVSESGPIREVEVVGSCLCAFLPSSPGGEGDRDRSYAEVDTSHNNSSVLIQIVDGPRVLGADPIIGSDRGPGGGAAAAALNRVALRPAKLINLNPN